MKRNKFLRYLSLSAFTPFASVFSKRAVAKTLMPSVEKQLPLQDTISQTQKREFINWHNGQTDVPAFLDKYVINWGGCSNWNVAPNAVEGAGRLGGDIFALTGDFVYRDGNGEQTYERYRDEFRKAMYRSDWQRVIRRHSAVVGVQDDHDYGKNGYAGADDGENTWAWNAYREVMPQPEEPRKRSFFRWGAGGIEFFMMDARLYSHYPHTQHLYRYPAFLGKQQWNWFRHLYSRSPKKLKVVILPISPAFASESGGFNEVRTRGRQIFKDFLFSQQSNCILLTSDRHACGHARYSETDSSIQVHEFLAGPMGTPIRHTVSHPDDVDIVWSNATPTTSPPNDYAAYGNLVLDKGDRGATVNIRKHDNTILYTYKMANIF